MKNFSNPIFLFIGLLLVASSVFAQPVNVTYSHTDPLDPNGIIWTPIYNPGSLPEIFFVANTSNGTVNETLIGNAYEDGTFIKSITVPDFTDGQILYTDDEGVILAGRDINYPNALVIHKFDHALTSVWDLVVYDVLSPSTNLSNIAMLKYYIQTNEYYMIAMSGDGSAVDPSSLSMQAISAVSLDASGNLYWAKYYYNTSTTSQSDNVSTITEYSISGVSYFAIGGTSTNPFQQPKLFTLPIDENGSIVASCNYYSTGTDLENPILKWDGSDLICGYTDKVSLAPSVTSGASLFKVDVNSGFAPSLGNYIWQGDINRATGLEIRAGDYVLAMEVTGVNPVSGSINTDRQMASAIINPTSLTNFSFSRYNLLQDHHAKVNNAVIDTAGDVYMVGALYGAGLTDELRMIRVDNGGTTCQAVYLTADNITFLINQSTQQYGEIDLYQTDLQFPNEQIVDLNYRVCDDATNGNSYKPSRVANYASTAKQSAKVYPTLLNDFDQNLTVDVSNISEDLYIEVLDILGRKVWEADTKNISNRVIQIPASYLSSGTSIVRIFGKTYSSVTKVSKVN